MLALRRLFSTAAGTAASAGPRFAVARTRNGNMPVYTEFRNGGTRQVTVVRKIVGDAQALKKELEAFTGSPVREYVGRLEVKGLHSAAVKQFLAEKGSAEQWWQ